MLKSLETENPDIPIDVKKHSERVKLRNGQFSTTTNKVVATLKKMKIGETKVFGRPKLKVMYSIQSSPKSRRDPVRELFLDQSFK